MHFNGVRAGLISCFCLLRENPRKVVTVGASAAVASIAYYHFKNDWVHILPPKPKVEIDSDVGNDPDDSWALHGASQWFGKEILLVTTTLYRPEEKAKIGQLILKTLQLNVPVKAGYGAYQGKESEWLHLYPNWPQKFGIPGSTNKVSLLQGQAYRKYYPRLDNITIANSAIASITELAQKEQNNLILISLAPLTNIAKAIEKDSNAMNSINRVVIMGGWFEDEQGKILRLGYNTAVDLRASMTVLEQEVIPVLIVSSEIVKKFNFTLREKEREVFRLSKNKTQLGEAFNEDMHSYWANKIPAKGELFIADVLTTYLARYPEAISSTQPVKLKFNENLLDIDMFHPQSKEVISVEKVRKSNIHVVTGLVDPEKLRKHLVLSLLPLFYPNVPSDRFEEVMKQSENPEPIAEILNQIQIK